ncbi:hypothetical protein ACS0TY_000350 [Phlomoides rotata]
MDFHMLSRRDLQALCKMNKIPANITNVAMAESLKALEFVEGIEEFSQSCQSETAQSSIESPLKNEVTSPYVPPTGGRSTRRRNVVKEEPETAKQSARAPRTARKAQQATSACKKMDVQEEKSGVSVTPAPSAVTTRRRRGVKEESTVNHAYSTRRSTRLAGKNVQSSNEVGNENLDNTKKELFTNDCQESKTISYEGPSDLDEVSGVTGGVDADITEEVNSKKEVEAEVDSAEESVPAIEDAVSNQAEADGAKLELKDTCDVVIEVVGFGYEIEAAVEVEVVSAEIEVEAETVSAEKQDMSTIDMGEPVPAIEDDVSIQFEADGAKLELMDTCDVEIEEVGFGSETEAQAVKEECDETKAPSDEIKAEEIDGSLDVKTFETEVQNQAVPLESEDVDVNYGENVVIESEDVAQECEDNSTDSEVSEDETEENVSNVDTEDVAEMNVNEEVLEINANVQNEIKPDASDSVTLDQNTDDSSSSEMSLDISLMNEEEESSKWETVFAYVNEKHDGDVVEDETKDAQVLPCLAPSFILSAQKVRTSAVVSDNKENIGSGGELAFTRERVKTSKASELELKEMSVRKLTKMLKEKLNIMNESSQNENCNQAVPSARTALQALPENRSA